MDECRARAAAACGPRADLIESRAARDGGFSADFDCGDPVSPEKGAPSDEPSAGETALKILGGAAGGAAAAVQSQPNKGTPTPSSRLGTRCRRDLDCGLSLWCAKRAYASFGVCAER